MLTQLLSQPRRFFLVFAAVYLIAALGAAVLAVKLRPSRQLFVADGFGYYAYLPALLTNHSLDFEPIFRQPEALPMGKFAECLRTPIGRVENPFTVGPALVWAPGYVVARGMAAVGLLGEGGKRPVGLATQAVVWAWACLVGLAGLLATYELLRRRFGDITAGVALTVGFWGTPVAAYLLFESGFSHGVAFAVLAGYLWMLDQVEEKPECRKGLMSAGLLLGLAVSIRPTLLIFGLPFFLLWTLRARQDVWKACRLLPWFVVPLVIFGSAQFIVWKLMYGSIVPDLSHTSWGRTDMKHPHLLEVLFSLDHGLFTWTPIWLAAVVGLFLLARRDPRYGVGALVMLSIHLLGIASNPNWNGDGAFGQRKFVDVAILFFVGLAYLATRAKDLSKVARGACLGLALLLCAHNVTLIGRYYAHRIPQVGPLTARQLWWF